MQIQWVILLLPLSYSCLEWTNTCSNFDFLSAEKVCEIDPHGDDTAGTG